MQPAQNARPYGLWESMNDRWPVCGKKTSEGKNGGKICFVGYV